MSHLDPRDLDQLRGGGGERFAHFVDRLVRATAAQFGFPQADIHTQLRTNIQDGGVDTRVGGAIAGEDIGWFQAPTCWQFKAYNGVDIGESALRTEIHKPHVEELILDGHAYRLCILGDLTPEKAAEWEELLLEEAQAINQDAARPRVVHGGHLVEWAERYPAVVAWLKGTSDGVLYWDAWKHNCHSVTPTYVPNPEWENARECIRRHVDFSVEDIAAPCLVVGGAAGVGKTRLVFETLNQLPHAPSMVLYAADDGVAKRVAADVANGAQRSVILVADECSLESRHVLNETLRGHTGRIRVICLDNVAPTSSLSSQVWLSADQLRNTEDILAKNFSTVPGDRRRQYARLAGGFVRLAADMCRYDATLTGGDFSAVTSSVDDYVRHRIPDEYYPFICLIALFHKVGYRDDAKEDLESLCQIAGCNRQQAINAIRSVKETPGFVVQAGRYWYVSPEIVARVLFHTGWNKWGSSDPDTFLNSLPGHLRSQLIDRAGKLASEEVRAELAAFFRRWFSELNCEQLANPEVATFACAIVEVMPGEYLPILRSILCSASPDELGKILGHAPGARWGPRRTLVWVLENLASLPDFFDDCEACLFALACVETEPNIGNNATAVWRDLFRVFLSGTATRFQHRLHILEQRLSQGRNLSLVHDALSEILSSPGGKMVGRPIVAGRLRPSDWQPSERHEETECYRATLALCRRYILSGNEHQRQCVFSVITSGAFFLLSRGLLQHLADHIEPAMLSDQECRALVNEVDGFIENHKETSRSDSDYLRDVEEWLDGFRPSTFDGRLRSICSRDIWDRRFSSDPDATDEMTNLADEIVANPSCLNAHLEWLATPEARASELLGFRIGQRDDSDQCAQSILELTARTCVAALARGYIRGMSAVGRRPSESILEQFDKIQQQCPKTAIDLLSYGGDDFGALDRAVQLVAAGTVPAAHLATFVMGIGRRELSALEVGRLLPFFVNAARSGDSESARAGLRFLETRLSFEERRGYEPCLHEPEARECAWELIDISIPHAEGQHSAHEWHSILVKLANYDGERVVDVCCKALSSDSYSVSRKADELLQELAETIPQAVMNRFGQSLLDEENGWRMQIRVHREIVSRLPDEIVLDWVRSHAPRGAQAIARHLPRPFVDDEGAPVVPHVLDVILREFGDDSIVAAFSAGVHSGESWWGNAADRFREQANATKAFLSHDNERIREWAKHEIAHLLAMADREDQEHEERHLPD